MEKYPTIGKGYSARGADMGRSCYGFAQDCKPRSVRLFRLPIDSGGYDPGGAYWGIGGPLYCAVDDEGEFRRFMRAGSREEARQKMGIDAGQLKRREE